MIIAATTRSADPDILDDLFHGCAFVAFVEQARLEGAWPDAEGARRRAYALYEHFLSEGSRLKLAPSDVMKLSHNEASE